MMQSFPPTHIIRHRRENLKKCSLRGLENRPDFCFSSYPEPSLPNLTGYVMLAIDGPPLKAEDASRGLLILDGTWRYAEKMRRFVEKRLIIEIRSIPNGIRTAYPRRQEDCPLPDEGLASIEAIYISYLILGRDTKGLMDHYYWKDAFLEKIASFIPVK
jgi:pre-rRNA-processing protein TSR3